MHRDTKHTLVAVAAVAVVIAVVFVGIFVASGNFPPRTTVVESESMQHGTSSQIGIIDTADMVILRDKEKGPIISYVEGYNKGYTAFGSYGDVVVYSRSGGLNPVIHRAILWLDYNGDNTWSAPSLQNYPSDRWSCSSGYDETRLSGILSLKYMNHNNNVTANINLDQLVRIGSESGFITMGDNNTTFDQPSNITGINGLITEEQIKSVAWAEVPWVGAFRMILVSDKMSAIDKNVPNTIPCLIASMLLIVFLLVGISFFFDQRYYMKYRKELNEDIDAPTPPFPVEKK